MSTLDKTNLELVGVFVVGFWLLKYYFCQPEILLIELCCGKEYFHLNLKFLQSGFHGKIILKSNGFHF